MTKRYTIANAPFDDTATSDFFILTSDDVKFLVHRLVFSLTSPRLHNLIEGVKFLEMPESSLIWDNFLRLCYPVAEPALTLDDAEQLLSIACAYEATCVISRMRNVLVRPEYLEKEPHRVYALALFSGMDDLAAVAARHTLRHPATLPTFPEARRLRGDALVRLLQYRELCAGAAKEVVKIKDETMPAWIVAETRQQCFFLYCDKGWACWTTQRKLWWKGAAFGVRCISKYWLTYMESVEAALGERPDGSVARTQAFIDKAIETAADCKRCRKLVSSDLDGFSRILEEEINKAITTVQLDVKLEA
ncbi:hypothetical protein BD311DRAFT_734037 [Dichomitus squalens]|uniref:BTB domain-containing protein n=1 Tax=Dichomitus squalens TaxID=114155 RepID=A0A4Q9M4J6_9APHY|nr:hypothetical protein BD311DRAFT_734037 [Dichomitus squalens]